MEYKVVQILSSREFYKMVDILNEILESDNICILDFTDVVGIDAVVIPNLLLLGRYIEKKTNNIPYIRLGEDLSAGYLKKYLLGIKFYELSDSYFYYEDAIGKYGGLVGKSMDKRNTTECFKFEDGVVVAQRRLFYKVLPFIENYLDVFRKEKINTSGVMDKNAFCNNDIAHFLKEMIENTFLYAGTDVIITVQTNYKKGKIFLSVSDPGIGFYRSMQDNMDEKGNFLPREGEVDCGRNILGRRPKNEEEAILVGIYKRVQSKTYGLFNVIKKILELKGIVRIHSNDRQIILTERLQNQFLKGTLLKNIEQLRGYNIINTSLFQGVHFEMELPLSIMSEEGVLNVYNKR